MDQGLDRLDAWRKAVGKRLRLQRVSLGLNQQQAADRACIHQTTWSRLERGQAALTDDVIIRVAPAVGSTESYLLFGVDTPVKVGVAA